MKKSIITIAIAIFAMFVNPGVSEASCLYENILTVGDSIEECRFKALNDAVDMHGGEFSWARIVEYIYTNECEANGRVTIIVNVEVE